jgi:hypothetical protein
MVEETRATRIRSVIVQKPQEAWELVVVAGGLLALTSFHMIEWSRVSDIFRVEVQTSGPGLRTREPGARRQGWVQGSRSRE